MDSITLALPLALSLWFAPTPQLPANAQPQSLPPASGPTVASAAELGRLRADCQESISAGLSSDRLAALSDRIKRLFANTADPADLLSILKLAGRLCWEGSGSHADVLREFALRELVRFGSASPRARVMLTEQFLPPLQRIEPSQQGVAVGEFDSLLDRLALETSDFATRRDLLFTKCLVRIEAHRAFDATWFDSAERDRLDRWLGDLQRSEEPSPDGGAYRELAAGLRRELRETPFGRNIGAITAVDLVGKSKQLSDFRGKVVVLTFWTSWCLPCLEMVPLEADLLRKLQDRGVSLVGVNSDATTEQARRTASAKGMTWPQLWSPPDSSDGLVARFCVRQWPSVIVLDREGAIRAKFVGSIFQGRWTMADVEQAVLNLLASR